MEWNGMREGEAGKVGSGVDVKEVGCRGEGVHSCRGTAIKSIYPESVRVDFGV
jgi:hypothetical protein